ncbi:MAG: NAD(P)H-dependent amine dehydrogenase family protein [Acidimicrobiia bacterium]
MSEPVDRIIVWGTGYVGKRVIAEIVDHPHFELAGVIVSDPDKDGRDVGEICGSDPIGITATTDIDAALARDADAVAYYGPTAERARDNIENMAKALRTGKDVVSTSMTNFVWWPTADRWMLEPMEQACTDGGTSCFTTGIDPGFANDLLPMTLMGVCGRVDKVTASEILDYATYTGDYEPMGYGKPAEFRALLEIPEILIMAWGGTVPMMADAMEVELDEITTTYDKWVTPERIEFANGVLEPDTVAAVHFTINGMVDGDARIVLEHVNRITNDVAPEWPRGRIAENDVYRVDLEGSPTIGQETILRDQAGDPVAGGCLATGMRALNAVPAVRAAPPGMLTALDLPLIAGRGAIR